jgi:ubiquinone/menaquinone biosynthesis C-methylase UbiE
MASLPISQTYAEKLDRWNQTELWQAASDKIITTQKERSPHSCFALDVGCGTGTLLNRILDSWTNARAWGVDTDQASLDLAARRVRDGARVFPVDSVRIGLPFPDGTFDWVVSMHALGHCLDPERLVREMARVLARGCWMTIVIPNGLYDQMMEPVNQRTGYKGDPTLLWSWSETMIRQLIRDQRLVCRVEEWGEPCPHMPGLKSWLIVDAARPLY